MKVDHAIGDGDPAKNWGVWTCKPPQFFHFQISRRIDLALQCNDHSGRWDERRVREDAAVLAIHEDNAVTYRAVSEKAL